MTEKELKTFLIDEYDRLVRILNAKDFEEEVKHQIRVTKAKLEALGVVTENLDN